MQRFLFIDYIKVLAICLVVLYHCGCATIYNSAILSMCVTLFFAVNGYLMLRKHRPKSYYVHKSIKLAVLIVIWGCIQTSVRLYVNDGHVAVRDVIFNLHSFKQGYADGMWFLNTLVILNLLYPFVRIVLDNSGKRTTTAMVVALGICTLAGINLLAWQFNPFRGWHSYALLYALTGYLALSKGVSTIKGKRGVIAILTGVFVISIGLQTMFNIVALHSERIQAIFGYTEIVFNGYKSVFVVLETITCIMIVALLSWPKSHCIEFISKNTLGIYLIHPSLIALSYKYAPELTTSAFYPLVVMLASCAICYMLSLTPMTKKLITT